MSDEKPVKLMTDEWAHEGAVRFLGNYATARNLSLRGAVQEINIIFTAHIRAQDHLKAHAPTPEKEDK